MYISFFFFPQNKQKVRLEAKADSEQLPVVNLLQ